MKQNVLTAAVLAAVLAGCATMATFATPNRIKAVSTLGAYIGAKKAIDAGKRKDIERSLTALQFIASTGQIDLPAIAQALDLAGVGVTDSVEGELVVHGLTILFTDFWSGTPQETLESDRVRAAMDGVIDGFQRALATAKVRGADKVLAELRKQAEQSRPRR